MKYWIFLNIFVSMAVGGVFAIAGQSACRDPSEIGHTFPNHWDPSKFWYCASLNEVAVEMNCPKDEAYLHLLKACVPWPNWVWKKPENPPTVA